MKTFNASLIKNIEEHGAWLAIITINIDDKVENQIMNPFTNALAGKKWINEHFQMLVPNKNIDMVEQEIKDKNNIPTLYVGNWVLS